MKSTFCQYHPIVNFLFFVGVIGMTVFFLHPVTLVISFVAAIAYGSMEIGVKRVLREQVLPGSFLLFITIFINPLFNHYGVTILGYYPNGNPITLESMVYGMMSGLMMLAMVSWFFLFTRVMTSEKLLYLFSRITPSLSLLFSMCLRFVPMYHEQLKKIIRAQTGIGQSKKEENLFKKICFGIKIFSILVTYALEHAIETSDSMRSRGFGVAKRTFFSIYDMKKRDYLCLMLLAVCAGICVFQIQMGYFYANFNPRIVIVTGQNSFERILFFASFCIMFFLPVIIEGKSFIKDYNRRKNTKKQQIGGYRLWEAS